jgi:5-methyltetrahydropteroyltriglutamate--homocysteine methyltransferase
MTIPTEQIGSIPRPPQLIEAIKSFGAGRIAREALEQLYEESLRETIIRLEQTDWPVITDGEQTKPSFATYPLTGLSRFHPIRQIP